jgi:ABC-type nitrate/sulfonate/bicarbonate transport system substrate-binding protein
LGLGQILVDLRKGEGPANFKGIAYESVATLRKTAQTNPRLVQGIIDAHTKAYCWVRDPKNFDELVQIMKAQMNVPELSDDQFRQMIHDEIPILKMTFPESSFPVWNEFLLKAKTVRKPLDPARMLWSTVPKSEPHC